MLTILLIQSNRLAIRTRLLAGLSVGLILLLLISLSFYKVFYYDGLSRFVSKNTLTYLHLDYRSLPENFYKIKVTDALLESFRLDDLDRHLIGSELAVLCDDYQKEPACGLIIQARRTDSLRQYLLGKHLLFRELDSRTLIIGGREAWLKTIKKSLNPWRYLKYQSMIGKYGALTLLINRPITLTDEITKALHLSGLGDHFKFSGAITGQGIVIKPANLLNILSFGRGRIKPVDSSGVACDLFIDSKRGSGSKALNDYIFQLFVDSAAPLAPAFIDQPLSLCLNRIDSTGDLISDFDIIVRSDRQLSGAGARLLEKALLNLAAKSQPLEKISYLSDGTRIEELWPRADFFAFESAGSVKSIKLNGSKAIFYSNSSDGLLISNKIGLNMQKNKQIADNYLSIRINSLPDSRIKDLLADFSYLTASDNQLVIR